VICARLDMKKNYVKILGLFFSVLLFPSVSFGAQTEYPIVYSSPNWTWTYDTGAGYTSYTVTGLNNANGCSGAVPYLTTPNNLIGNDGMSAGLVFSCFAPTNGHIYKIETYNSGVGTSTASVNFFQITAGQVATYAAPSGYFPPTIQINTPVNNATTTDFTQFAVYTANQEDYSSAVIYYTASSTALNTCYSLFNCAGGGVTIYSTYPVMATATASFIGKNAQANGTYYARANLEDAGGNNVATSSVITYGIYTPPVYTSFIDADGTVYYYSGISASTTASTTTDYNFAGGYTGFIPTSCNWLDIGCNLVNAGGFLFTPSVDAVNKLGSLQYEVRDRFPFSYFQSVINGIDALHATSTTQMVSYNLNLHDAGIGTTSPMGNILPNFTFLSSSSIQSYYPAGLFDAFKGLVSAVLWLMWIQYMFFRVRDFDFKK